MNTDVQLKTLAKIGQGSRQPHLANMMIWAEQVGFVTRYSTNIVIIININMCIVIIIIIIIIIIIMNIIFIIINFVVIIFIIIPIIIILIVMAFCNNITNKF
jgi:hypothetical protein